MNITIETVFISVIGLLALAFFIVVLVDLVMDHRMADRRRMAERMEEEATAILAALAAYEQIREAGGKSDGNKEEVNDGKDKAL